MRFDGHVYSLCSSCLSGSQRSSLGTGPVAATMRHLDSMSMRSLGRAQLAFPGRRCCIEPRQPISACGQYLSRCASTRLTLCSARRSSPTAFSAGIPSPKDGKSPACRLESRSASPCRSVDSTPTFDPDSSGRAKLKRSWSSKPSGLGMTFGRVMSPGLCCSAPRVRRSTGTGRFLRMLFVYKTSLSEPSSRFVSATSQSRAMAPNSRCSRRATGETSRFESY